MTGMPRAVVLLDASVLYPALLRNILMYLAPRDLFQPFWSERIHDEWTRSLIRDRPDLSTSAIERTRRLMTQNIEGAMVTDYEHHIEALALPDPDDRHVLAAAIQCEATVIVTANLRDFPAEPLARYRIEAQHPDIFIPGLIKQNPMEVVAALRDLRGDLKKPRLSIENLLEAMGRQGLNMTANGLLPYHDLL